MQINDCIRTALGGVGQINDLLLVYYQTNGATAGQINDAEHEFLIAQGVIGTEQVNDMWLEFLTAQGYTGALNDMLYQFWCVAGGVITGGGINAYEDLDNDGLPDTVISDNGTTVVTEDADSINIDQDGDGVMDVHVPKP